MFPRGPRDAFGELALLGNLFHQQAKIKHKVVATLRDSGTLSRAHHVVGACSTWDNHRET